MSPRPAPQPPPPPPANGGHVANGRHDDERTPLLSSTTPPTPKHPSSDTHHVDRYGATSQPAPAAPSSASSADRPLLPVVLSIWVPVFVASLDGTIVATLLGSISSEFGSSHQASWLGSSYLLSVACFTPIYGRLCDLLGRRASMLLALSFFTLGTLLCGVSTSMPMLLASRALAGMGGGGLTTVTSTIMSDLVPLRSRGLWQGLTNIIFGLGSGLGGPVGGVMNDTLGWRNALLVQVPLLVAAMVLCVIYVDVDERRAASGLSSASSHLPLRKRLGQIDFLGSLFLVATVAPSLVALSLVSSDDVPWSSPWVWGQLLVSLLCLGLFLVVESRLASHPVLPLALLSRPTGGGVALANLFLSVVSFSTLYNFPLLLQATRLMSASQAGFHLIPYSVALSVGSVLAGVYMRQTGVYWRYNLVNAGLMALCGVLLCLVASPPGGAGLPTPHASESLRYSPKHTYDRIALSSIAATSSAPASPPSPSKPPSSAGSSPWPSLVLWLVLVPAAFGTSGVLTCTLIALINSVAREDIAVATGMSYLFRTTGQVVGVSASGAVVQATLKRELRRRIRGEGAEELITRIRHRSNLIPTLPAKERAAAVASYGVALRDAFVFTTAAALLVVLASWRIEDRRLPDQNQQQQGQQRDEEGGAGRREDPSRDAESPERLEQR